MRKWLRETRLSRSTRLFPVWRPTRNGSSPISTRVRCPDGFNTSSAARAASDLVGSAALISTWILSFGGDQLRMPDSLLRPQNLTVRAVAGHLRPREDDLEPELRAHLGAQVLQLLAKELLHAAAPQANDVRMLLLHAGLVVVLVALEVSQVELIYQAALFQQLEGAIHRYPVELRIALVGHSEQAFRIQVQAGLIDQIEQQPTLAR